MGYPPYGLRVLSGVVRLPSDGAFLYKGETWKNIHQKK